jgi:hypothetical protein
VGVRDARLRRLQTDLETREFSLQTLQVSTRRKTYEMFMQYAFFA